MFHADGRTDRKTDITKLAVVISNCANAPKNPKMITVLKNRRI